MSSHERDGLPAPARSAGDTLAALRLRILGRVQGVGFRPFVARVARSCRLTGWVKNTPEGVVAHVEGTPGDLADFRIRFRREAPPAAEIHELYEQAVEPRLDRDFRVVSSDATAGMSWSRSHPTWQPAANAWRNFSTPRIDGSAMHSRGAPTAALDSRSSTRHRLTATVPRWRFFPPAPTV